MSSEDILQDPTNRIVAVFDETQDAQLAREACVAAGIQSSQIRVFHGAEDGDNVDTSAKWFADTDEEIARYQHELRAGNTVISIPIEDGECREEVHAILQKHNARLITHFGQWVTEMMK